MDDFHVIIAWNSDSNFLQRVEDTFDEKIVFKKTINLTPEQRGKKINDLYAPIHVPLNSKRCTDTAPITIYFVKITNRYKYIYRTEGYRLCNIDILNFKIDNRKIFDFNIFHCSDSVEETKRALQVFELEHETPKQVIFNQTFNEPIYDIVEVENIYVIRHLNDGNFEIAPIKDSVCVLNLIGYPNQELIDKYSLLHISDAAAIVNEKSVNYFLSLPDFNQSHDLCEIKAYKYKDKYIIVDGKHRASMLYFKGHRHIFLKRSQAPCSDTLIEKNFCAPQPNSHLENFNKFIYNLHNEDVHFVVMRGYDTMPRSANTDLDIVIHPKDYNKFLQIVQRNINEGTISFNVEKNFNGNNLWYRAYRTNGIHGQFLSNSNYQFDTYSNVFFFASEQEGAKLSDTFVKYFFDTKQMYNNLPVPNPLFEMVLLFCRTWIDLKGNWKPKHKARFDALRQVVDEREFKIILEEALPSNFKHLQKHLST